MTKAQHTPGPWHTGDNFDSIKCVYDSEGRMIADCDTPHMIPQDDQVANARLIAATPILHETLKQLLEDSYNAIDHNNPMQIREVTLSKARNILSEIEGE